MSYWHAVIALGFIILGAMWVYELWDIFNERIESHRSVCQCGAAKSDARATFGPTARALGERGVKEAKIAPSEQIRSRAETPRNDTRARCNSKEMAQLLSVSGEQVKK